MRTGAISNAQITASSIWDHRHEAFQGRLNFQAIPVESGSWSAERNDLNQWLEVFIGGVAVTGIATQGRSDLDQWVTLYMLMFNDFGLGFKYYKENGLVQKVRYVIFTFFSCCCCCLARQLKYDSKSLLRNLNSSWCCSLRPLNTAVHLSNSRFLWVH